MSIFKDKNIVITGASRGIGLSIAKKLASEGSNITILAKTDLPHPKLPGTIFTAAKEIEEFGTKVLPIKTDIRFSDQVEEAILRSFNTFGKIDILINNASAINLFNSESLPMKRYDLMFDINVRGTYLCSKTCLTYLKKSENPHILNLSPPINLKPKWFENFTAYTMSKFGMSMCTLGMSSEYKKFNIGVNSLWTKTAINTSALSMLGGFVRPEQCRQPLIVADAAYSILKQNSKTCTGNFFIDEDVLRNDGEDDFDKYAVKPGNKLFEDLFLD
ncbi:MAG: Enoyl-[acyl-carrier-protein] reductase [NADPH] FabL [Alphaproteobacteria bacterium MarineAlpha5_Bin11]|nr:short chain dehydrogenase [Pelagibacteraceae bacterium]PPR44613.1 MAG: Enoyl-[acyl-carrier-protein] reductase [NADPH] FabL [Alphaproteobacteria bacterium MarineAlpha5_Bin11]|tara:strand:+ start:1828 stop:2649 length:822 start_codon:yes stop_codon:yes gene_type:complete